MLAEEYGDLVFDTKAVYSLLNAVAEKETPSSKPLLDQLSSRSTWPTRRPRTPAAPRLASAMLVADSLFSIQEVPKPTNILAEGEKVPSVELVAQGPAWSDERKAFFDLRTDVLERGLATREVFLSTLRLLLVLTRDPILAAAFVERDGLCILFSAFATETPETTYPHSYVVVLLRHVIEEPAVLQPLMEREIEIWFGNSRSKMR
ncbi:hypothetical protein JCM1841_001374 [Sporobolomyces salmonicolor]